MCLGNKLFQEKIFSLGIKSSTNNVLQKHNLTVHRNTTIGIRNGHAGINYCIIVSFIQIGIYIINLIPEFNLAQLSKLYLVEIRHSTPHIKFHTFEWKYCIFFTLFVQLQTSSHLKDQTYKCLHVSSASNYYYFLTKLMFSKFR